MNDTPPQKKSINKIYRTINSYECGILKFHQKPRLRQWILTLEWNFTIPHEYVIKGYFLYIILHKCDFWQFFLWHSKVNFWSLLLRATNCVSWEERVRQFVNKNMMNCCQKSKRIAHRLAHSITHDFHSANDVCLH